MGVYAIQLPGVTLTKRISKTDVPVTKVLAVSGAHLGMAVGRKCHEILCRHEAGPCPRNAGDQRSLPVGRPPRTARPAASISRRGSSLLPDVFRAGIRPGEFWPAMHAAEGLTLAGYGGEVRSCLN